MYKTRHLEMCLAFPSKHTALRKLPARFVMLLLFLHSLDMFILVRFFTPLLHLIILYGLLDFNLYVFMSFLYYRYLLLYLFISVFISLIFIYFLNCKCLIFEKSVWLSAHCKWYRNTFQFHGILSPSSVEKPILLLLLLLDHKLNFPSKQNLPKLLSINIFKHCFCFLYWKLNVW